MSKPTSKAINTDSARTGRPNSIYKSAKELDALLDEMEESGSGSSRERQFVRWSHRIPTLVGKFFHGGMESGQTVRMACRNLSCGGAALLHGGYVHVGTKCVLAIPNTQGELSPVRGEVVRCRHVRGIVHDLGIKFAEPIDARDYVRLEPFSDEFLLEKVDPEELAGCVVLIDPSEMDRKLAKHFLSGTQLRLREADTPEQVISFVEEGCDIVVTEHRIGEMSATELARTLREQGHMTPVLLVTADRGAISARGEGEDGISAVLPKPLSQDTLLRAMAEYLLASGSTGPIRSMLPPEHPNHALVEGFVGELPGVLARLREAVKGEDADACRAIGLELLSSASPMGFEAVGQAADAVCKALDESMSVAESLGEIRALQAICERVRK